MLVDVILAPDPELTALHKMLAEINGNDPAYIRRAKGVYEIGHFNFEHEIGRLDYDFNYPKLERAANAVVNDDLDEDSDWINCYGVADSYQQVIDSCVNLRDTDPTPYCMSITPINKRDQPDEGGWRWHKWGPYIGTQKPTHEYLYDEPNIELVFCYHIYQLPLDKVDTKTQYDPLPIQA